MADEELETTGGLSREYLGGVFAGVVIGAAAGVLAASYLNRRPPCPCEADELEHLEPAPAAAYAEPVPATAAVALDELSPQQKAAPTRAAKRAVPEPTAETGPASPSEPIFPNVGGTPAATAGPFAAANGHR